jgi:hypothetical protein
MTERTLASALEETLGFIERSLAHIHADHGAEVELRSVRAYLLEVLELVERDPGIEAASDDLFASATALAGTDKGSRMSRLTNEAFLRFRDRLASARPSERARQMGLR